ncbi:MAG: hypothetical protein GW779_01790 [Candidatus Altiarchaeum hamiconexum]|uniref:Uncharacterized protein n=1 Tax=Candidatus Altarchaeum hamiconexum TaxID=1803513 RepID=A0A8J8CK84_9ARCH|nr:hypothetical protein [Candidatus Altarchaeum hamiconexum]OIQ06333.1 MAG: hypothetical protein AUK59_00210 [Candidatus Altarchaeum sp. CG2_30_32_3053]PIN66864.1 MAG: hypothetical protein COV98_05970 [Candidatus Altarchaeum sp. CG12_big_fil_rev_8_21_14_0_65_33_22]PIV27012.1 MAG: hypothetical protein COS36_07275 [Candidatus Altarchaeum sp. CG03_land_8_20_14_0_80_32_618]PIX49125.1 MAG: hypothetical protein COZ53_01595 [Candidatus Altarchaeum sp. CG_4_8_14_3_um_filter_33_2054]PIZ32328.1 MAG: hyp
MSDTFVTSDQFNKIQARLQKPENRKQHIGKYEDVCKNVEDFSQLNKQTYIFNKQTHNLIKLISKP